MVTCLPFLILPDVFSGALGLEQDSALPSCQGHSDPSTLNFKCAVLSCWGDISVCLGILGASGAAGSSLILQDRKEVIEMNLWAALGVQP